MTGHEHRHVAVAVQAATITELETNELTGTSISREVPVTYALWRCVCRDVHTEQYDGHWALEQVAGA